MLDGPVHILFSAYWYWVFERSQRLSGVSSNNVGRGKTPTPGNSYICNSYLTVIMNNLTYIENGFNLSRYFIINFQIYFPAITVCNQNRANCAQLKVVKEACEQYNNAGNVSSHPNELAANVTICSKYYNETVLIINYLYDKGGCALVYPDPVPPMRKNNGQSSNEEKILVQVKVVKSK